MNIEYEILNPLESPDWDERLEPFAGRSSFYSRAWAMVLHEAYGYQPHYFGFRKEGILCGIIPMMEVRSALTGVRGVSLPFSDFCPPLLDPDIDPDFVLSVLFDHGKKQGWKEVEFRGGDLPVRIVEPSGWYYRHRLTIPESDEAFSAQLKHSTRSNIRKALSSGLEVVRGHSSELMEEFVRMNVVTRKRHGLPPQPGSFFRKVHEHIIAKNQGSIFVVRNGEENLSALLCFECGDTAFLKYAATRGTSLHLRPNNILIWEIVRRYREEGLKVLDFGRTDPNNDGLRRFKRGWGLEESVISYFRCEPERRRSISRHIYSSDILSRVFRVLPTPVLRFVGRMLYRHIG